MNKKKKSTNTSPYPDEVIDRLARAFYPAILACWNSEEGQREFAAWQAEQAHHANKKEIQEVPAGELPGIHIAIVCGLWQGASGWAHPVFVLCSKVITYKIFFYNSKHIQLLDSLDNFLFSKPLCLFLRPILKSGNNSFCC